MKTSEIKVLVDPETRAKIDQARELASISAWVRDAIELKLKIDSYPSYNQQSRRVGEMEGVRMKDERAPVR